MGREEYLPSESEWKIMEQLWSSPTPLTTLEIQARIGGGHAMALRTVRVLTNRLLKKGLVGFEVDEKDARVYHYHAQRSREECVREKSRSFVESYFAGNRASAFAALLQADALTGEQIAELERLLEKSRGQDTP